MGKTQGWEKRLSDYIDSVRNEPFKRSIHDCAIFTGACIEKMTGVDFITEFRGSYDTKEKGFELIKTKGFNNLEKLADAKLGQSLPKVFYAGRGDCVLIEVEGNQGLGIIDLSGRRAVTVGKDGLVFYSLKDCVKAWKV